MKWEQFERMGPYTQEFTNKVLTDIECPKCGKNLFQRTDIVLTSHPAQYQYECECGFIGYSLHNGIKVGEVGCPIERR